MCLTIPVINLPSSALFRNTAFTCFPVGPSCPRQQTPSPWRAVRQTLPICSPPSIKSTAYLGETGLVTLLNHANEIHGPRSNELGPESRHHRVQQQGTAKYICPTSAERPFKKVTFILGCMLLEKMTDSPLMVALGRGGKIAVKRQPLETNTVFCAYSELDKYSIGWKNGRWVDGWVNGCTDQWMDSK